MTVSFLRRRIEHHFNSRPESLPVQRISGLIGGQRWLEGKLVEEVDGAAARGGVPAALDSKKEYLRERIQSTGGLAWVTDGREIENYLPPSVLKKAIRTLRGVDVEVTLGLHDDLDVVLKAALSVTKEKPMDYAHNKLAYSRKLAEWFSLEEISGALKAHMDEINVKVREWKA